MVRFVTVAAEECKYSPILATTEQEHMSPIKWLGEDGTEQQDISSPKNEGHLTKRTFISFSSRRPRRTESSLCAMERSDCQPRGSNVQGIAGGSGPAMGSSEGSEFGVEWRFQLPFFAGMSQRRFASPTQTPLGMTVLYSSFPVPLKRLTLSSELT